MESSVDSDQLASAEASSDLDLHCVFNTNISGFIMLSKGLIIVSAVSYVLFI